MWIIKIFLPIVCIKKDKKLLREKYYRKKKLGMKSLILNKILIIIWSRIKIKKSVKIIIIMLIIIWKTNKFNCKKKINWVSLENTKILLIKVIKIKKIMTKKIK